MTPHGLSTLSLVLLIFQLAYYLLTSPAFLLVRLDVPQVRHLMRTHVSGYLIWLRYAAAIAALALAFAGRPVPATLAGGLAVVAFVARRWLLARIDARIADVDGGDAGATRRLRRLHVGAMLCNAAVLAVVASAVNGFVAAAA